MRHMCCLLPAESIYGPVNTHWHPWWIIPTRRSPQWHSHPWLTCLAWILMPIAWDSRESRSLSLSLGPSSSSSSSSADEAESEVDDSRDERLLKQKLNSFTWMWSKENWTRFYTAKNEFATKHDQIKKQLHERWRDCWYRARFANSVHQRKPSFANKKLLLGFCNELALWNIINQ